MIWKEDKHIMMMEKANNRDKTEAEVRNKRKRQ
jgi:hypothetical protein